MHGMSRSLHATSWVQPSQERDAVLLLLLLLK
jgi:hypothetical protein